MPKSSAKPVKRARPTGAAWVYAIRNIATGERLIGGAVDVERAWRRHQRRLNAGIHNNLALQEAWEEQGADAFAIEYLEEVTDAPALRDRMRAWVAQEHASTYNTNWYPRLRPRAVTYRHGDQVQRLIVSPPVIVHRMDLEEDPPNPVDPVDPVDADGPVDVDDASRTDAGRLGGASAASQHPTVVAQTTYRLPFSERDLPLLLTTTGTEYVPADAWCAVLGVQLRTHLWRLRRTLLWREACEFVLDFGENLAGESGDTVPTPDHTPGARSSHTPRTHRNQAGESSESSAPEQRSAAPGAPNAPNAPDTPPTPHVPLSAGTPSAAVWCLPRERFLIFTTCLGWKRIDPALHPALKAMWAGGRAEDERQAHERQTRIHAYGEIRRRVMTTLIACEHLDQTLQTVEMTLGARLAALDGAELVARCARGRALVRAVADAARTALDQLHAGGITECTTYDPEVDAMRTRILPNNPTLPDLEVMAALDTSEEAFATWMATFIAYVRHHLARSDGA